MTGGPAASEPPSGRRCIFCHSRGPLTREHVIATWITGVLSDMEPGRTVPEWQLHYTAGGLINRNRQHQADSPTVVVRAVCEACNSGWMSDLESRVMPFMAPMIRGERITLTAEQQIDLATWSSKTIAALELHESTIAVTRPEDRRIILEELRPPHHHCVRIAYRREYLEALLIKTMVARSEDAEDDSPNAFATLLIIGSLVVQVWGGHGADTGGGLALAGTKSARAIMVWPPTLTAVEWPPVTPISDEDLDDLAREVIPWSDDSPDLASWRTLRRQNDG